MSIYDISRSELIITRSELVTKRSEFIALWLENDPGDISVCLGYCRPTSDPKVYDFTPDLDPKSFLVINYFPKLLWGEAVRILSAFEPFGNSSDLSGKLYAYTPEVQTALKPYRE